MSKFNLKDYQKINGDEHITMRLKKDHKDVDEVIKQQQGAYKPVWLPYDLIESFCGIVAFFCHMADSHPVDAHQCCFTGRRQCSDYQKNHKRDKIKQILHQTPQLEKCYLFFSAFGCFIINFLLVHIQFSSY